MFRVETVVAHVPSPHDRGPWTVVVRAPMIIRESRVIGARRGSSRVCGSGQRNSQIEEVEEHGCSAKNRDSIHLRNAHTTSDRLQIHIAWSKRHHRSIAHAGARLVLSPVASGPMEREAHLCTHMKK